MFSSPTESPKTVVYAEISSSVIPKFERGHPRVVVKAFFSRQRQIPRQNFRGKGRGKAATAKTEARQDRDRGRDVETEARQSGTEARPRSRQDEPRHLKPIIIITTVLLPCKNVLVHFTYMGNSTETTNKRT